VDYANSSAFLVAIEKLVAEVGQEVVNIFFFPFIFSLILIDREGLTLQELLDTPVVPGNRTHICFVFRGSNSFFSGMSRYFLYPFYNKNRKRSGFFARSWILFCGSFEVFGGGVTDRDRATVLLNHTVVAEASFTI
jgi:hypothetical protein